MSSTITRASAHEMVMIAKSQSQRPAFIHPGERAIARLEKMRSELTSGEGPLHKWLLEDMRLLKHFSDLAHPTKCPEAYCLWSLAVEEAPKLGHTKAIKRARARWGAMQNGRSSAPAAMFQTQELSPA